MTQVAIGNQTVETQAEVAENWGTSALIEDAVRHGEGVLFEAVARHQQQYGHGQGPQPWPQGVGQQQCHP